MAREVTVDSTLIGPGVESAPDRFYPSIAGLRGVAAFSVIFAHIYLMSAHAGFYPPNLPAVLAPSLQALGCSTGIFFIISGFVVPASLFRHRSLKRFFTDRILRIMPVYVVLHLLVFVVGPFIGYKWLRDIGVAHYLEYFITNLTFTALPLGLALAQQNSWTLTYEWAFYIIVAAAWATARRTRGNRWVTILIGLAALATCIVFPIGWGFLLGMVLARFRPTWRMGPALEAAIVPASWISFYYVYQSYGPFLALPFALVIFWAVLGEGTYTARFLCLPALQFLGLISYSLYLVHPIVMFAYEPFCQRLARHGLGLPAVFSIFALISIVTTPFFAAVSYRTLEVGLRRTLATWNGFDSPAPKAARPVEVPGCSLAAGSSRPRPSVRSHTSTTKS